MLTNGIKVKFIKDNAYGFIKGNIYNAFQAKSKFGKTKMICIINSDGEEYAYPASWFEVIE